MNHPIFDDGLINKNGINGTCKCIGEKSQIWGQNEGCGDIQPTSPPLLKIIDT